MRNDAVVAFPNRFIRTYEVRQFWRRVVCLDGFSQRGYLVSCTLLAHTKCYITKPYRKVTFIHQKADVILYIYSEKHHSPAVSPEQIHKRMDVGGKWRLRRSSSIVHGIFKILKRASNSRRKPRKWYKSPVKSLKSSSMLNLKIISGLFTV